MATFVRNRVLQQLSWTAESERTRSDRRAALCELDGLLAQLEEANLRGSEVPARVIGALRRRGVAIGRRTTPAELIEATFIVQERYIRQPQGVAQGDALVADLRRRMAS